jgi:hypothetical protein
VKAGSGVSWLVGITLLALVGGLIIYSYSDWPGSGYFGIADKKFWDYLELLIVPAALAIGVYLLNRAQSERERKAEDAQQERALAVENQRAQDEALQAYLDQMGQLLLDQECPLRQSKEEDDVRTLARARTLTVMPRLDGERKGRIIQFLYEAGLITKTKNAPRRVVVEHTTDDPNPVRVETTLIPERLGKLENTEPIVDLSGAYLREVDMEEAFLHGAFLSGTELRGAEFDKAILTDVDLACVLTRSGFARGFTPSKNPSRSPSSPPQAAVLMAG